MLIKPYLRSLNQGCSLGLERLRLEAVFLLIEMRYHYAEIEILSDKNSSVIVDLAMRQIPRSTERISSLYLL